MVVGEEEIVLRLELHNKHLGALVTCVQLTNDLSAYDSCQSVEAFDLCSVPILIIANLLNDTLQTSSAPQV